MTVVGEACWPRWGRSMPLLSGGLIAFRRCQGVISWLPHCVILAKCRGYKWLGTKSAVRLRHAEIRRVLTQPFVEAADCRAILCQRLPDVSVLCVRMIMDWMALSQLSEEWNCIFFHRFPPLSISP